MFDGVPILLPPSRRAAANSAAIGAHQTRTQGKAGKTCAPESAPKSVLITGASGFVGSRLCEVLTVDADHHVRAFVHSSGKAARIARYPLDLRTGDLMHHASVRAGMTGVRLWSTWPVARRA